MYSDGESFLFVGLGVLVVVGIMFFSLFTMDDTGHDYTTIENSENWGAVE